MLINPVSGRPQRAIIFGLLDDRSRIIPYLEAGFVETEHRFLTVLYNAIARKGIPRKLLLDNHASFTGHDLRLLCAKIDIHLVHSRPGDGPTKGKIERFWRSLREHVVDRLDLKEVTTIDELNLRLWSYVESEYHCRPHASHSGKTPMQAWEEAVSETVRKLSHIRNRPKGIESCGPGCSTGIRWRPFLENFDWQLPLGDAGLWFTA
jgi:transposase InsO family protein